jgi:Tfp pilus assembly protein PilN
MEIMTTNQMETMKIMNFGFLSIQLKDLDGRIDRQEQVVKKEPRNENAKQVLYELRQDRKKVVEQMDSLKEKK